MDEVLQLMGKADYRRFEGNKETWEYRKSKFLNPHPLQELNDIPQLKKSLCASGNAPKKTPKNYFLSLFLVRFK